MSAHCVCDPLTKYGATFNQFIGDWFSLCVYAPSDYFAFFLGLLNLLCWLGFIHVPQLILNHKNGSAAALSLPMLLLWVVGDLAGLFSCFLTGTYGTVIVTQFYYFLMDFALVVQYFYFKWYPRPQGDVEMLTSDEMRAQQQRQQQHGDKQNNHTLHDDNNNNEIIVSNNSLFTSSTPASSSTHGTRSHIPYLAIVLTILSVVLAQHPTTATPLARLTASPHNMLNIITTTIGETAKNCAGGEISDFQRAVGTLFGFICAAIYSPAKVFLILKNKNKKSTKGLSYLFIGASTVANVLYLGSVLFSRSNIDRFAGFTNKAFFTGPFPFVLVNVIGFVLNIIILYQMRLYGEGEQSDMSNALLEQHATINSDGALVVIAGSDDHHHVSSDMLDDSAYQDLH